jgi:hypothetical protein
VILLTALLAGSLVSLAVSVWSRQPWRTPEVKGSWFAILAFLPQFILFYLPATGRTIPDAWGAVGLVSSQIFLLAFCWLNRHTPAFWLLAAGLAMNLAVIIANGGFMPISPETASRLIPLDRLQSIPLGSRFGHGKDILLLTETTRLALLSDRLLPPLWFPYQVAFSLGDVFIANGVFLLMVLPQKFSTIKPIMQFKDEPC